MTEATEAATPRDNQTDETLQVAGETVIVREFRYREGLEAAVLARPFLAGLRVLMVATNEEIEAEDIDTIIAENRDSWLKLVALSCGRDVAWVADLPDQDAMNIQLAFWSANSRFFKRRLLIGAAFAAAVKAQQAPTPSPPPAA